MSVFSDTEFVPTAQPIGEVVRRMLNVIIHYAEDPHEKRSMLGIARECAIIDEAKFQEMLEFYGLEDL